MSIEYSAAQTFPFISVTYCCWFVWWFGFFSAPLPGVCSTTSFCDYVKHNYTDFRGDLSCMYLYTVTLWENQTNVLVFNLGRNQKSVANVDVEFWISKLENSTESVTDWAWTHQTGKCMVFVGFWLGFVFFDDSTLLLYNDFPYGLEHPFCWAWMLYEKAVFVRLQQRHQDSQSSCNSEVCHCFWMALYAAANSIGKNLHCLHLKPQTKVEWLLIDIFLEWRRKISHLC